MFNSEPRDAYISNMKLAYGLDRYCSKILQASGFAMETFGHVARVSDKVSHEFICYKWIDSDGVLKIDCFYNQEVSLVFNT